ncbi:hypothetical protein Q760_08835 [Cellulomonas cellasea DSM 20118]|uniref:Diguanylate cyclase n=1 Tax=Cellulomonas cellasea DSM 20118 TaxID=1408250 RepID=A0A0A0B0X5_9CELL|nr:hypothetical protein Q760_08835 [Cellulomonas cellasea DSM 20118]
MPAGAAPQAPPAADAYAALLEDGTDAVIRTDATGAIVAANAAARRLLGRDQAELRRAGLGGVLDPADERWGPALVERAATGWFRGELRARRPDGSTVTVDLTSTLTGDGGAVALLRTASDGAPALQSADDLRRAAEAVIDTLESVSDAYFAVDEDWTITYMNRNAELVARVDRFELVGRGFWDVFPSTRGTVFEERYRRVMSTGEPEEFEGRHEASDLWVEVRAYPLPGGGLASYSRDVTERHVAQREREELLARERAARAAAEAAQRELTAQATHDNVTGLLNRWGLLRELRATTPGSGGVVLMFLDLDRFKLINDTFGHVAGDQVLAAVAERLRRLVGPDDLLARFGGDEFVVVLRSASVRRAEDLARRLVAAAEDPIPVGHTLLPLTTSIGLAAADDASAVDTLLREADAALHRVKAEGRDGFAWFDEALHRRDVVRVETERDLRRSLRTGDALTLHFQPAFALDSTEITHIEALARWDSPGRGPVPPAEFIPVAEESGLILAVGERVLACAVRQVALWPDAASARVWVNVSPRQLAVPGLADTLLRHLDAWHVAPGRLGIEVTESTMDDGRLVAQLEEVRRLGVAVAIDDFGTGYSSLSRLAGAPVDVIKIDRSFVAAGCTPKGRALLEGIVTLAHAIGAYVIAEGIETPQQLDAIAAVGADAAAGFLLARPQPATAVSWRSAYPLPRSGGATVAPAGPR